MRIMPESREPPVALGDEEVRPRVVEALLEQALDRLVRGRAAHVYTRGSTSPSYWRMNAARPTSVTAGASRGSTGRQVISGISPILCAISAGVHASRREHPLDHHRGVRVGVRRRRRPQCARSRAFCGLASSC
jgi:hypothetical protein